MPLSVLLTDVCFTHGFVGGNFQQRLTPLSRHMTLNLKLSYCVKACMSINVLTMHFFPDVGAQTFSKLIEAPCYPKFSTWYGEFPPCVAGRYCPVNVLE